MYWNEARKGRHGIREEIQVRELRKAGKVGETGIHMKQRT